jgi:hypothetical protein
MSTMKILKIDALVNLIKIAKAQYNSFLIGNGTTHSYKPLIPQLVSIFSTSNNNITIINP